MKLIKSFPDGNEVFTGDVVDVDNGMRKECVRMIEYRPYQDMYEGETYHTLYDINERWFRSDKTKHIQEYFPFSIDFLVSQFKYNDSYKIEHRNQSDMVVYLKDEPIIVVGSDADGKILKMKAVSNYGSRIPLVIINECIDKSRQ